MGRVDLHVHTTASDGAFSPLDIVEEADKMNLVAVAITDHDTMQGYTSAEKAGNKHGIEIIPGLELSTDLEGRELHVLGYYCAPDHPLLQKILQTVKDSRFERMGKMLLKLKKCGIEIKMTEVLAAVKGKILGRPHLAALLCQKGHVKTKAEAFHKYIGKGCPAYVERYKLDTGKAIKIILQAGGIPVLAHPGLYHADNLIPLLIDEGLAGVEVFHPDHHLVDIFRYLKLAQNYNLLITGGSDFHGKGIGVAPFIGYVAIDYQYLRKLKNLKGLS